MQTNKDKDCVEKEKYCFDKRTSLMWLVPDKQQNVVVINYYFLNSILAIFATEFFMVIFTDYF